MTVSDPTTYPNQYTCNSSLVAFDFLFSINDTSEVEVIITDSDGEETTLTETTDYSVSATNDDYSSGGTVTTETAYSSSFTITLRMAVAKTQETDFTENMETLYENFEAGLDKLTRLIQQLDERIDRCLSFPDTELTDADGMLPAPEAGKYLQWNTDEDALQNAEFTSLGNITTHASDGHAHAANAQSVTISSGVLDLSSYTSYQYFEVNAESGTEDSLTKITGLGAGDVIYLKAASGDTITLENGAFLKLQSDFSLVSIYDRICLQYNGSDIMCEVSRSQIA